jgi:hypothetical protein
MAASPKAIIHDGPHGLPHAAPYYAVFPREPSPAGHLTINSSLIHGDGNPTLQSVLDEIARTVPGGRTLLLVCHATAVDKDESTAGLLIPLSHRAKAPSVSAVALTIVMNAAKAYAVANLIRPMPEKTSEDQK